MKRNHAAIASILVIYITGCGILIERTGSIESTESPLAPPPVQPVPLPFSVLHKADFNIDDSTTSKKFAVLDTVDNYQSELSRYSVEIPKPVDFSSERIVLATMGTQPSGGYAIGVQSAIDTSTEVVVTVYLQQPGGDCVHTQAISNPYEFALVETTKPIVFEEVLVTELCE